MKKWETVIDSNTGLFDINLREVWQYRDLCITFVRKNYITKYKQTVLGPLYMILSPLVTSGIFSVVFGTIAGISTDGIPNFLFYLSGNLVWNYFNGNVLDNSNIFEGNAYIMGKVYFPRLVIPLANALTKMINLLIQTLLFLCFYLLFCLGGYQQQLNDKLLAVPFFLLILVILGNGMGLLISSLTVKYKDFHVLLSFGLNLLMYATPVIYPLSNLHGRWRILAFLNPVTPVIELFRFAFFGNGVVSIPALIWSVVAAVVVFMTGLVLFHKVEKTFIDTI